MPKDYLYDLRIGEDMTLPCQIHFSNRKSLGIQIKEDASIHVRAPYYARKRDVEAFVMDKKDWIYKHFTDITVKITERKTQLPGGELTPAMKKQISLLEKRFRKAAKDYIPRRCAELQKLTGGYYTKITIRNQKTRWGSCSQTGTLSFNYRLMMAEPAVIDYVIIHELCHLTHMNHSKAFWDKVEGIMPDYKIHKNWLKEHGSELTEAHYLFSFT